MNLSHHTDKQSAVSAIVNQLHDADEIPNEVGQIIQNYQIHIDELTERGLAYETACAIEQCFQA